MAIVQLQSTNPDFSYIIQKNPESPMLVRTIRKGMAFGWFSDANTYNVYFKDAENEISYERKKNEKYEYLNATRYHSPLFPLNAVTEFFTKAAKTVHEKDNENFTNTFFCNTVYVRNDQLLIYFQKHLPDFVLTFKEIANKTYQLKIQTNKSINELLNYVNVFFLYLSIISKHYLDLSDEIIEKYMKSLIRIDSPFYIRYLFVKNILTTKKKFNKYKHFLEQHSRYSISFAFGPTNVQRRDYIAKHFQFNNPIVDIGCGEGFFALPFSQKINPTYYYAIDIDEQIRERLTHKLAKHKVENVIVYDSLDNFLENFDGETTVDVLLTEVIEHMSIKEASALVKKVLSEISFEKFIITTPNADFNTFYELTEMRHADHKWEMTANEFYQWIQHLLDKTNYQYSFEGVGDCVNGIYTTQAAIISRAGDK